MKTVLEFVLLSLVSFNIFGQNYDPLIKGEIKTYGMTNGSYTKETLKEDVLINNVKYSQIETVYSWGTKSNSYIRIDEHGNRIYLDKESNLETIEFPYNIKIGHKWISTDKAWSYEIISLSGEFSVQNTEFKKCLVIKARQLTNRDKLKHNIYFNFYVDQIGYIGSTTEERYVSWLKIDI